MNTLYSKKNKYKPILTLFFFFFVVKNNFAQTQNPANTKNLLTYNYFLKNVTQYHPYTKQAALQNNIAEAQLLQAKGNFDPTINAYFDQKNFEGIRYFQNIETQLTIPTHSPLNITANYQQASGQFLNPQEKTTKNGLWAIGLEANLIQGLLIDNRRASLKQAYLQQKTALNQQAIILNELCLDATLAYLNWQQSYAKTQIITQAYITANQYFIATKQTFLNGEKTAIDTLEAHLLLQDQLLQLQNIQLIHQKNAQYLQTFLFNPIYTTADSIPQNLIPIPYQTPIAVIDTAILFNTNNNPYLIQKQIEQQHNLIDLKLKNDKLKPKLKLKLNPLIQTNSNLPFLQYNPNNYKIAAEFELPLRLRTQKGAIQQTKIKLQLIENEIQYKQNLLENKIQITLYQLKNLNQQINLQKQNAQGYQKLLDAEYTKFNYGESSIFLLNKRQEKLLDAQLKIIELYTKYNSEVANYLYLTNQIISQ